MQLVPNNLEASNSHTMSLLQHAPSITRNTKTLAGSFYFIEQYLHNIELPQTAKDIPLFLAQFKKKIDMLRVFRHVWITWKNDNIVKCNLSC